MQDRFDGNTGGDGASAATAEIQVTPAHPVDAPTPVEGAVLLERQQIVHDLLNPLTVVRAVSQPIVRNVDRGRPVDASRLVADMHLVNDAVTKAVEEIERFMVSARATNCASVVPWCSTSRCR